MLWLKILAGVVLVLILLIVLLCRTRVGVRAAYGGGVLELDAKVGLLTLHLLPGKEKPEKKQKPKKQKKPEEAAGTQEKPKKALPKISFADIKDAIQTLWPPLKRALNRTRKGIRISPLKVSVVLGGLYDPAKAAEQYGYIQTAVWTGMPVLENLLDIRETHIHTGVDFDAPVPAVEGTVGISIRIGTLLGVGLGVGFPALRWFLKFRKKGKQAAAQAKKEGTTEKSPAKPEEAAAKPA